jgi:2-polyprenyl-3-methyl-5-hydroxy-6-metoxy-1,4-benzoquinol methylase
MFTNGMVRTRNNCPVCCKEGNIEILNLPMTDPILVEFQKYEKHYSSLMWKEYTSSAFENYRFIVVKCIKCGSFYQKHVLSTQGMEILYNNWLDQKKLKLYYSSMKVDENEKYRLAFISKYFHNKINILDYGAGYGNFLKLAHNKNMNLFAYDLGNEKNDFLSSDLHVQIIDSLESYDDFFDFINMSQVLEHVPEPAILISNLTRALKKGGLIFISTPNCRGINRLLTNMNFNQRLWTMISPFQHINAFDNSSLKLICRSNNLTPFNFIKMLKYLITNIASSKFFFKQVYHHYLNTNLYFIKNN